MPHDIDQVVLRPGDAVHFGDRDELLEKLDALDRRVPGRQEKRTRLHREHYCIVNYLRRMAGEDRVELPVTIQRARDAEDPPDFTLLWPASGRRETFELTDGSTEDYQRALSLAAEKDEDELVLPVDINTPTREASELWSTILFDAFRRKSIALENGRFEIDHLLIYDLTGLGLLIPMSDGAPRLRQQIEQWVEGERPRYRFRRVSILRDTGLLLDVTGEASIVRAESPYYRLPIVRAHDEEDLRRRLREIDRYCRENAIRHLKLFGSILGDRDDDLREGGVAHRFDEKSDVDVLVEFEPDACVTLIDMARMERELSELLGFEIDLRTVGDLSRYFRQEVVANAVELDAARA